MNPSPNEESQPRQDSDELASAPRKQRNRQNGDTADHGRVIENSQWNQ